MIASGFSRWATSVSCGPANAVFMYRQVIPSFDAATVASMKPRWLRHITAIVSPSPRPSSSQAFRALVHLVEGEPAELVDDRVVVRVARGVGGVPGRRRESPPLHGEQRAEGAVGALRSDQPSLAQRLHGVDALAQHRRRLADDSRLVRHRSLTLHTCLEPRERLLELALYQPR